MPEEINGKMAMKKMQVYKWHKCFCDGCESMIHAMGWRFSLMLGVLSIMNLFQKGIM
jgi:hypothetical protein